MATLKKKLKGISSKLEAEALHIWKNTNWNRAVNYLKGMGFTPEQIEFAHEQWSDGKSIAKFSYHEQHNN